MNLLRKMLSLFARDKFYELKNFIPSESEHRFKYINYNILSNIVALARTLSKVHEIEDSNANLSVNNGIKLIDEEQMKKIIKQVLVNDYEDNLKKSKIENWDFEYFIDIDNFMSNTLLIVGRLFYTENQLRESSGNMLYNLVAIKKIKGGYFIWDMSDD